MWPFFFPIAVSLMVPPTVEVETLDGARAVGRLVALGQAGLKLDTDRGQVSFELSKLAGVVPQAGQVGWDNRSAVPPPQENGTQGKTTAASVWLELVDGSTLAGSGYTAAGNRARLTLPSGQPLDIPTQDIKWVRFQPQTDELAGAWSRIRAMDAKNDLLAVKVGQSIDYHKGLLRDVTADVVNFDLDGEAVPVKRARVFGAVYYHPAGRKLPESLASLSEASGAVWSVQAVLLAGQRLEWTTPTGLKLATSLAAVKRVDFTKGKIVYLSDLEPESVQWTPYIRLGKDFSARTAYAAPRRDRSRDGGPLALDAKDYGKGLALASRTLVVYRLPDRYTRLSAVAGIDDRVRPHGSVRLTIRGDEKTLLEASVAGSEAAKPISLDMSGVRRLSILVDFGADPGVADYLDLGDAKLVK